MRCFVVVPGALVPAPLAAEVLGAAHARGLAPLLERLLARATMRSYRTLADDAVRAPHLRWTWQQFSGRDSTPVTAPYVARTLDAGVVPPNLWHCDPIHVAFARDHLLVNALDDAPLSEEEATALLRAADEVAQPHGARLMQRQEHWFIAFDAPWRLQATPLAAALDASLHDILPEGPDAARWRQLFTEIQMQWHADAVNEARSAAGQPAVNAVWLHGGGPHVTLQSPFDEVWSDDLVLRGWAAAAGAPHRPLAQVSRPIDGEALVLLPALAPAHRREAWGDWLGALAGLQDDLARLESLVGGGALELLLFGTAGYVRASLATRDRWRLWRKQPLEEVLAEPLQMAAA